MIKTGNFLRILTICIFIGIVSCKSKKKTELDKNKFSGPPLPPLLPPVPPIQQIEYLTRQQLAFIRHHQQLAKSDKGIYNPYACLPKYICIVEDEAGDKRTTIVSSLHPALRDIDKQEETAGSSGPAIGKIHVPQLAVLGHYDPEGLYRDRIVDDGFLKDQEEREKFALAQSLGVGPSYLFQAKLPSPTKKGSGEEGSSSSSDKNSEESNEDINDDDDGDDNDDESQEGDEQHKSSSPVNKSRRRQPPGFPPRSSFKQNTMTSDTSADHIATVPWNDSPSISQKPEQQTPTKSIGGGFLRRMLFRSKRDTATKQPKNPFMTRLGPGIKSSDQCRILYNGCDLKYDEIMRIAAAGQVLIEKDDPIKTNNNKLTLTSPPAKQGPPEDDEVEQAQREASLKSKNKMKPGGFAANKIKYPAGPANNKKHPAPFNPNSPYNKHIKMKPKPFRPAEDEVDGFPIASLPVLPMKFHFGKPIVPVKKGGQNYQPHEVSFGETPNFRPAPQRPATTTPTPPIFVKNPVYKKVNRTTSVTNVVQVNSTHALKIVKPTTKPYRPGKAPLTDSNGRPVSFASVFTEIAGSSGGIHDFFDKVALAVGGPPGNNKRAAQKKKKKAEEASIASQSITRRGGEVSSEEEEDDEERDDDDDDEDEEDEVENEETPEHNNDEEDNSGEDDEDTEGDDVESSQDDLADEGPVKKEAEGVKKVFKYKVSNKKKETNVGDSNNKQSEVKNKKKDQEDEEGDEEEEAADDLDQEGEGDENDEELNDDAEVDVDLPEFLPDHIKQGIIEDIKNPGKRQKEAEAAGKKAQQKKKAGGDEEDDDEDGSVEQPAGGPGGPQPHGGGRPGGPPGGPPGGFGGQRPGGPPMRQRPSYFRNGPQGPPPPQGPPLPKPGSITIF